MNTSVPSLLSEKDAAAHLGLSVRTLQRWRLTGAGPVYRKIGGRCLYAPADLADFIDKAARRSTSEVA